MDDKQNIERKIISETNERRDAYDSAKGNLNVCTESTSTPPCDPFADDN